MRIPYRPDALYYPPRRCPTGKMKKVKVTPTAAVATAATRWWERIFRMNYVFVWFRRLRSPGTNKPSVLTGSCYGPDGACFRIPVGRLRPGTDGVIGTTNLTCRLSLFFVQRVDRTGPLDSCRSRLPGILHYFFFLRRFSLFSIK